MNAIFDPNTGLFSGPVFGVPLKGKTFSGVSVSIPK